MAKAKTLGGLQLSGKLGDTLVFVRYGDEMIVRMAPSPRKKDSWSSKQQSQRVRFRAVTWHYRWYKETVVVPIWNLSATVRHTGFNLFVQANMPAFDQTGKVSDYSLLHFSTGPVPLPQNLTVERNPENPAQVQFRWSTNRLSQAEMASDKLMVFAYNPGYKSPLNTGASRADGVASLDLPTDWGDRQLHLYLYFQRADGSAYSNDRYFTV
ncbi:DUF6266 family protein [Gaoshiqia sediminis]|uniref:DUF6266 family protein n=1 Tax=Gaoshiqia sediminis TaxID=2986998 RepID=A0AA41Y7G0_9BACT|nr:DUF6266 family protein [Gaoshiqia sediminis]MCW0483369.1 DUF6266 family protein [Gaoshiqia sediminis]